MGAAPEVTPAAGKMLTVIQGEMSRAEIQQKLGLTDEKHFREHYQQPAVAMDLIEMTIPDKPLAANHSVAYLMMPNVHLTGVAN